LINKHKGIIFCSILLLLFVSPVFAQVTNQPPVADAGGPYSADERTPILFVGSASNDPDGIITSYLWDFGDGQNATGPTPNHTYLQEGTYQVTLTVTDDNNLTNTANTTATIQDTTSIASFTATPTSGTAPLSVSFTDTSTNNYEIRTWDWTFGDGQTATGSTATHTYLIEGQYTVNLTITETDGNQDTHSVIIDVFEETENQPPVADAGGPYSENEGTEVNFDGSASYDDGNITSYFWDFGDNQTGTGLTVNHTYLQEGDYTVSLTVFDDESLNNTDTTTANIVDTTPIANFTANPTSGNAPLTVTFTDESISYDNITNWDWKFGNLGTSNQSDPVFESCDRCLSRPCSRNGGRRENSYGQFAA